MKQFFFISIFWVFANTMLAQTVFINEVRYKGSSSERGVEIAGPAGTDLSDYILRFYESDNSTIYHSENLSGTIPNQSNSYGSVWFPVGSYQDADNRAVELYDQHKAGGPEDIIYYGTGAIPTINGQLATYLGTGIVQTGVGVIPQLTPQLVGTGTIASDFTWVLQAPTISGIVQGNGLINVGQFFSLLPVELITFKATTFSQSIQLQWRTASELNNSYFEIERSVDGSTFESVGKIKGEGTSNVTQHYQHIDQPNVNGTYYYRLKQVDKDGTFEYSGVISVEVKHDEPIKISPNPVRNNGTLNIKVPDTESVNVELYNTTGQLIKEWYFTGDRQLDMNRIQPGLYFILIRKSSTIIERRQIIIIE